MTTSALPDILTDILREEPIPEDKIAYLVARAKLRLHNFILGRFEAAEDRGVNQATIARRLGISRARVSQQLGVPGNWTIESVTRLAAAMGGEIGDFYWLPFPSEGQLKLEAKTTPGKPEQLSRAFQAPANPSPLSPEESDEHPS